MRIKAGPSLASQVGNALRIMLTEQYADGGRLPGEHELALKLGVNRSTVREALEALTREGLITRRQGSGTCANPRVIGINTRLEDLVGYKELISSFGFKPSVKQFPLELEEASSDVAHNLNIPTRSLVLVSREILYANGKPVIYVEDKIPQSLIREEAKEDELAESVLGFLEERCYQRISYCLTEIIPRVCDGPIRKALGLPPNQAVLQCKDILFNVNNEPILTCQSFFREPFIRFHLVKRRRVG